MPSECCPSDACLCHSLSRAPRSCTPPFLLCHTFCLYLPISGQNLTSSNGYPRRPRLAASCRIWQVRKRSCNLADRQTRRRRSRSSCQPRSGHNQTVHVSRQRRLDFVSSGAVEQWSRSSMRRRRLEVDHRCKISRGFSRLCYPYRGWTWCIEERNDETTVCFRQ